MCVKEEGIQERTVNKKLKTVDTDEDVGRRENKRKLYKKNC